MNKPELKLFALEKLEDGMAVLVCDKDQAVVSEKLIPKEAKVGDKLLLEISDARQKMEKKQQSARELLNEILGSDR